MSDDDVDGVNVRGAAPTRQTQRVWEADLTEPGRRLTLDELRALEAMHSCQMLQELSRHLTYLVLHTASIEGRLDRLEQYLQRIDARYPRQAASGLLILPERGVG